MGSATKLPPHLGGADVLIALGCVVLVVVVMKINNDFAVRQDTFFDISADFREF